MIWIVLVTWLGVFRHLHAGRFHLKLYQHAKHTKECQSRCDQQMAAPSCASSPPISCPRVFSRRCCIQWRIEMFGGRTHIGSMGWLGACSSPLHSTFKHAVPVNRTAARSAHESTADRQNGSWHILAENAKHNLANSCLGKWAFTECTSRQIYTDLLNDCSNFTIALK